MAPLAHGAETDAGKLVRVGYTEFPPYSQTSGDGVARGISIDMMRLLLEPQGYVVNAVPATNPTRMLRMLEAGEIDATSMLGITTARAEVGNFTRPVGELGVTLYYDAQRPGPDQIEGLSGMRIGVVSGSFPAALVQDLPNVVMVSIESNNGLLLSLLRREVDAIAAPDAAFTYSTTTAGLIDRVIKGPVLHTAPGAFLVGLGDDALLATLDAAIETAQANGALARITQQWLSNGRDDFLLWRTLALALLATAMVGMAWLLWRRLTDLRTRAAIANCYDEAFSTASHTVSIYDADGGLVHVSPGFHQVYPYLDNHVARRDSLPEMIVAVQQSGLGDIKVTAEEAREVAARRMAAIDRGETLCLINRTAEGRTLQRRTFKGDSGRIYGVTTDVSDFERDRSASALKVEQLQSDNRRLRDFSAVAAHDLKAPLRNVRMLYDWVIEDFVESGADLPESVREKIAMANTLLERQNRLIADLLGYARGGNSQDVLDFQPVPRLEEIIALAAIPPDLKVIVSRDIPAVQANPVAFDTVLRNLLSNAARHHDSAEGEIAIVGTSRGEMVEITVTDDGPGVPADVQEQIFEPFYRHSEGDHGGSGLGLALVRREVEGWGGTVRCRDRRDGLRGAEFVITIPAAGAGLEALDPALRETALGMVVANPGTGDVAGPLPRLS